MPPRETPPEVQQFGGVESPAETSHPAKQHDNNTEVAPNDAQVTLHGVAGG